MSVPFAQGLCKGVNLMQVTSIHGPALLDVNRDKLVREIWANAFRRVLPPFPSLIQVDKWLNDRQSNPPSSSLFEYSFVLGDRLSAGN